MNQAPGQDSRGRQDLRFHGSHAQVGDGNNQFVQHVWPWRGVWSVVAGVLSVVLAAAAGAILVVLQVTGGRESPSGAARPGPATPSASAPATDAPDPTGPALAPETAPLPTASPSASPDLPAVPTTADRVRWEGRLRFGDDGPRLDEDPPVKSDYLRDVWLGETDPAVLYGGDWIKANLALWQGSEAPTRAECAELVSTQGVGQVEVDRGSVVCIRTIYGRTAVLTIVSVSSSRDEGILAEARVWSETDTRGIP
ncbi:hypothetical protein [Streptomyces sp. NPDC047928]|uniref:hypothetical protein n=1 Tax=unclassified Streptomyces TaxID=2593676 RepID=UPI0037226DA9